MNQPGAQSGAFRILPLRARDESAHPRAVAYAIASALLASPHAIDPRLAVPPDVLLEGAGGILESLAGVVDELGGCDLGALRLEYSGLFEVGNEGPPVSIREEHHAGSSGQREEIVRFFEHFGYSLGDGFAWQPDHLSIELEFLQFLCQREAAAANDAQALPYQLAQRDFTSRHVARWLPMVRSGVEATDGAGIYRRVVAAVCEVVAADLAWQQQTIQAA